MRHLLLSLIVIVLYVMPAQAGPNYRAVIAQGNKLSRSEDRFKKALSKLSVPDQGRVKKKLAPKGPDSDGDGVGDLFEGADGSKVCDPDSDHDGVNDGQDGYENDGDKVGDVSANGPIVSFDDPTSVLVVGDTTFTLTDNTSFRGITRADLVPDACVEVEGYTTGAGTNIATKVKGENSCGGGDGNDGGGHNGDGNGDGGGDDS